MLRYIGRSSARLCARQFYNLSTAFHQVSLSTLRNGETCVQLVPRCTKPFSLLPVRWSSSQDSTGLDETDPLAIDLDAIESNSVDQNEDVDALQPTLDHASTEDCQIKQLVQCNSMIQVVVCFE